MRVLITGASGQLATELARVFTPRFTVYALRRQDLDITSSVAVLEAVAQIEPDVIVNCAAFNAVDAAEDDPVTALRINGVAVETMAAAAARSGAILVHFSSDFVFDGAASTPYSEDDRPDPPNAYGLSKLVGDWFARRAPRHYLLRVESLFGGDAGVSTVDWIITSILEGRATQIFADRTTSPSYIPDVAAATLALIERGAPTGLYNCVNSGYTTWYELAREAMRLLGMEARLVPVAASSRHFRAPRPLFCALSNAKLAAAGYRMPTWEDALRRHIQGRVGQRRLESSEASR